MKISFVIPSYNSAPYLVQGLTFLAAQEPEEGLDIEVIVVDDGSTDGTKEAAEPFQSQLQSFHYVYRSRDELSNRSRARNLGIRRASGDVICFLDAGIIVPPAFAKQIAVRYRNPLGGLSNVVLLHMIYGVHMNPDKDGIVEVGDLEPEHFQRWIRPIMADPLWQDMRGHTFAMLRDQVDLLAAPWELGLVGSMTVPAWLVRQIEGFDDSFTGWGSEDIDFTYRLYRAGASFRGERQAYTLHIPHPTSFSQEKMVSDAGNRRRMHQKSNRLETELYMLYQGLLISPVLEKMNQLSLARIFPEDDERLLTDIRGKYIAGTHKSLLIGVDQADAARQLGTSHLFVHKKQIFQRFADELCDQETYYLLGCSTLFPDRYFEVVVVTDFIRLIHPYILRYWLQEMHRISRQIVWIHGEDQMPAWAEETVADRARIELPSLMAKFQPVFHFTASGSRAGHLKEMNYWSTLAEIEELCDELHIQMTLHPVHRADSILN